MLGPNAFFKWHALLMRCRRGVHGLGPRHFIVVVVVVMPRPSRGRGQGVMSPLDLPDSENFPR